MLYYEIIIIDVLICKQYFTVVASQDGANFWITSYTFGGLIFNNGSYFINSSYVLCVKSSLEKEQ